MSSNIIFEFIWNSIPRASLSICEMTTYRWWFTRIFAYYRWWCTRIGLFWMYQINPNWMKKKGQDKWVCILQRLCMMSVTKKNHFIYNHSWYWTITSKHLTVACDNNSVIRVYGLVAILSFSKMFFGMRVILITY